MSIVPRPCPGIEWAHWTRLALGGLGITSCARHRSMLDWVASGAGQLLVPLCVQCQCLDWPSPKCCWGLPCPDPQAGRTPQ